MKGDFSRLNLFDPLKQYTRVMQQQGRVQLDADWNEQTDILLHYLRTLAADLIGPFGGPAGPEEGFQITPGTTADNKPDLTIGRGRYYVDGVLCEIRPAGNEKTVSYLGQPHPDAFPATFPVLVYLDVWERHVTYLQDDSIREVALGGADTTTRTQVVWRARVTDRGWSGKPGISPDLAKEDVWTSWGEWVKLWKPSGRLRAQAKRGGDDTNPCTASPEASYRSTENQLYRVEIQEWARMDDGQIWLTFKWSRENGSVAFAIEDLQGEVATLASLGWDDAPGLKKGDWVEIVDDDSEGAGIPGPLRKVEKIDEPKRTVTLEVPDGGEPLPEYKEGEGKGSARAKHALLRRWDHRESAPPKKGPKPKGAVLFVSQENPDKDAGWLTLENGIRIQFEPGSFRPGDYWLIPARTATGDIEWPGDPKNPEFVLPHGVEHHYAPLALIGKDAATLKIQQDLRRSFGQLAP